MDADTCVYLGNCVALPFPASPTTPNSTFHSWRHTFRTRLAESGASTETAMRLCGHTDEKTSARYDHDAHLEELRTAVKGAMRNSPPPQE